MDLDFGKKVKKKAEELIASGKDANQTAGILFGQDPGGHNYGIGIILKGDGSPMESSAVLTEYLHKELSSHCSRGTYMNSTKLMEPLKEAVLRWQKIPESFWPNIKLVIPSDAGTGAVKSAVEYAALVNPEAKSIGVEELGWPAYKAIAKAARIKLEEFPHDTLISEKTDLTIYQAGPMNTTGQVRSAGLIESRAKAAAASGATVILDRAYSGFEFAREIGEKSIEEIMHQSYDLQLRPFFKNGVNTVIALSPTKAFVTFAFRPCGFLLVYTPDPGRDREVTLALNAVMRARGSSFEHPVTRAFVKAMAENRAGLEAEQRNALLRLAEAEKLWAELVAGTDMEPLFSDRYAGLFRNPRAREGAAESIYGSHLYPVLSQGRCRLNATGLPSDRELAAEHVKVFSQFCYE